MATAAQTIQAFVAVETVAARAYGDAFDVAKAEVAALQELIKRAKAELELAQELAIDQGFATRKEVWTEEHTVKGHYKRRFTWAAI
jgi:hypothetical protein